MKKLLALFIVATVIDATLTLVGLHLGWSTESNELINIAIRLTHCNIIGVILVKVMSITLCITLIISMYNKRRLLVSIGIVMCSIITMIAGLSWLFV